MADYNINAATRRVVLSGSAGTGPYSFTFAVLVQTDLAVYLNSTKLTLTTDYTVSIAANGTGTVTLNTGTTNVPTTPTSSDSVIIVGARALERTTDFVTAGDLRASALNEQLDANVIFDQQLAEENQRTVKAPVFDPATTEGGGTVDMTLPAKDTRKGKYLAFNETTGNPEAGPSVSDVTTVSAAATDIALLADIQDGTTATNAITTVASNNANITTVAGISANVTTVASKASLITSDFVSDLNTLATSAIIEDLGILATADIVSDLNTLATSDIVSDLNTLATSDIVSDINLLATSDVVSDLNTLATSDFVSDLNTLATSTNVNNISTVATNIAGVTSFAERYRVGSSDPSSSLDEGDLAFNTTDNNLKFYNGSAWVSIAPGISDLVEDTSPQLGGTLDANGNTIDMDGNELILDADADTSITADTDDQIDFKVGGSDKASLTSSGLNVDVIGEKTADAGVSIDGTNIKDNAVKPTDASGTDQAGTALTIKGGAGTGTGSGGSVIIQTADGGSSGSSVNAHATQVAIIDDGSVGVGIDAPVRQLHLNTAGANNAYIHVTNGTTGTTVNDGLSLIVTGSTGQAIIAQRENAPLALWTNNTERMRVTDGGNVVIGATATSNKLEVRGVGLFSSDGNYRATNSGVLNVSPNGNLAIGFGGDSDADYYAAIFHNSSNTAVGSIFVGASSTTYATSSDYRLKENVANLTGAIERVKALAPKRFNFIADPDKTVDGFLAHEAATVVPEAVQGEKDAMSDQQFMVTPALGNIITPATDDADEVIHSTGVAKPDTLEDGREWIQTASPVMETRSAPDYQGIDQSKLVPVLTAALQEAIAKIEALENRVAALEG